MIVYDTLSLFKCLHVDRKLWAKFHLLARFHNAHTTGSFYPQLQKIYVNKEHCEVCLKLMALQ